MVAATKYFQISEKTAQEINEKYPSMSIHLQKIIDKIHFPLNEQNEITKEAKLDIKSEYLDDLAENTYHLANQEDFKSTFKTLIDHQLRIVQYFRLFQKFNNSEQLAVEKLSLGDGYENILKNSLKQHDTDKMEKPLIAKYYLSQEVLAGIPKLAANDLDKKNLEFAINKIRIQLRAIHGNTNDHHNEYYNITENKEKEIKNTTILEHVCDINAVGDKRIEVINEFYSNKKDTNFANFAKKHDELINNLQEDFKKIFKEPETLKLKLKGKEKENRDNGIQTEEIKANITNIQNEISEQTEKIVWGDISDGLDNATKIIKDLQENVYLCIEKEWACIEAKVNTENETKEEQLTKIREEKLKFIEDILPVLSEFKKEFLFDEKLDLKTKLKEAVSKIENDSKKLIKVSAILSTLNPLEKNEDKIDDYITNDYITKNENKITSFREYIKNNKDNKKFFTSFPIK